MPAPLPYVDRRSMSQMPDAFTTWEAERWEERAAAYHQHFTPLTSRFVEPLLDHAEVGPGCRLLDVASGPGYAAAAAAARGAAATGVDIAGAMVKLAGQLHPEVTFVQVNAERLPFDDGSFDAVVGNLAILHFGQPEEAVREFHRVLVPGGRVALSTWDVPAAGPLPGIFFQAISEAGAAPPADIPPGPPFYRFADEDEFARLLDQAGLAEIGVATIGLTHRFPGTTEVWNWLLEGTVRSSALVRGQPELMVARIRRNLERLAAPYANADGTLDLPSSVKIGHGRRG